MKTKLFVVASVASLLIATSTFAAAGGGGGGFPLTKSDCKNNGWENYGGIFKNQGDCVSFVVTDGANSPNSSN